MGNANRFEVVESFGGFVVFDEELKRWCGRCGWAADRQSASRDPFADEASAKAAVLLDVADPSPAAEGDAPEEEEE